MTTTDSGGKRREIPQTQGGESEELLGRWRRDRGIGDEVIIATKVGARPVAPGISFAESRKPSSVMRSSSITTRI